MAVVTRYFSTAAAGAGNGTTWADRAQLVSGATWSTVITGFNFAGSDSLLCLIGPGTHSPTAVLQASLFANPPTVTNPLIFHGCDSSGVALTPPDPDWTSDQPAFDDSGLPVIATTTNISTSSLTTAMFRLIKMTASGRNGTVLSAFLSLDWVVVANSTANSSAGALGSISSGFVTNSVLSCSGSSYSSVVASSGSTVLDNVRVVGVTGSSGNRDGCLYSSTTTLAIWSRLTIINNGGRGFAYTGSNAGVTQSLNRCVIANNGGDGVQYPNTASQTNKSSLDRCCITGNGGYGINPGGANTNLIVTNSRLRDNTSNNFNTWGNWPQTFDNYTTDSDDATEYVDAASTFDFRIKAGSAISGKGYGVSDQAAAGFIASRVRTGM